MAPEFKENHGHLEWQRLHHQEELDARWVACRNKEWEGKEVEAAYELSHWRTWSWLQNTILAQIKFLAPSGAARSALTLPVRREIYSLVHHRRAVCFLQTIPPEWHRCHSHQQGLLQQGWTWCVQGSQSLLALAALRWQSSFFFPRVENSLRSRSDQHLKSILQSLFSELKAWNM